MPYSKISKRLEKIVSTILNSNERCVFEPECIFVNPNTGFKYTCRYLNSLDIIQDYVKNYTDNIQMAVKLTPKEYQSLLDNMQDLECIIKLNPVNMSSLKVDTEKDPIILENMRVVMDDQTNLNKTFHANAFHDDENLNKNSDGVMTPEKALAQMEYRCNLIAKDVYALRHVQLNSILTDTSLPNAINWLAFQFGAENNIIVPPDNDQVYTNFVIEPMKGISDIFGFIQNRYGIYSEGLGYYYTNKTLYIYPQYNTSEDRNIDKGILRIFNVPENSYAGNDRYHYINDNDVWILSNSSKTMTSLNTAGEENYGGTRISMNPDNQRDFSVTIEDNGEVKRDLSSFSTVLQMSNKGGSMSSSSQNLKFEGQRSNVFLSTSEMAAINGTVLNCGWPCAKPMLIKPGQVLTYEYDDSDGTYATQKGRILACVYKSGLTASSNGKTPWVKFDCYMSVFLDPEKKSEEVVQR